MTRTEQIRHALLVTLYGTRATKVAATFLQRDVARELGGVSPPEVMCELELMCNGGGGEDGDKPLVTGKPDPMGSTLYYQLTAAGVLAYERNH